MFQTAKLKSSEIKRVGCSIREKNGKINIEEVFELKYISNRRSYREEKDSLRSKRFRASSSSWEEREKRKSLEVELLSIIH